MGNRRCNFYLSKACTTVVPPIYDLSLILAKGIANSAIKSCLCRSPLSFQCEHSS